MNGLIRVVIILLIAVLLSPLAASAHGRHGGFRGGIWIGPAWGPWWVDPYPYYYQTQPLIIQEPATDYYVQPVPQESQEPVYWYYCRKPEGYYPYIKRCPDGWMKVVPTPPANK